jgi:putative ABC transport system substrate-binding protein
MVVLTSGATMRRREFIVLMASSVVLPLDARAQQSGLPVIGFLSSRAAQTETKLVEAFLQGLNEQRYAVDKNVTVEYRWAEGQYDRLQALAAELVGRKVSLIVTTGGAQSALAAKLATTSIPIVFATGDDPVALGLVNSLNRPGGNATGVAVFVVSLVPKRLQLLRELLPTAKTVGFLINPKGPAPDAQSTAVEHAARALDVRLERVHANTADEIDQAFSILAQRRPNALLMGADPFFQTRRDQLVALAARYALPTMYEWREFVEAGGLISYAPDRLETMRQMGTYAGQVLQGSKPSELPVVQASKFELVINLKTAKALNLTVPLTLLAQAEVLE